MKTAEQEKIIDDPSGLTVRRRLRFLAKDSVIYGGASALNKSFALITFPLLARHFSVEAYGIIDFFSVLSNLVAIFLVFGQDSAVARFFYDDKDSGARRQVVSQSFWFQAACLLTILPLMWLAAEAFSGRVHNAPETALLLKLILLQTPFVLFMNFSQNLLKWTFMRAEFLILNLASTVGRVLALVAAVTFFDTGLVGVFIANFAVSILAGLLGIFYIRRWLTIPKGMAILRQMLPFALPLGVICCLGAFAPTVERSIIIGLLGDRELGLYAAGTKVALLIALPIQAFQMAWGPFSLSIFKEANAITTYNWVLKWLTLGLCAGILLLAAGAGPLLAFLASERYSGSAVVVFPIALGLAAQAIGWIPAMGIDVSKRTSLSLYSYVVFLLLSASAIFGLGSLFGLVGVAYGVMLGQTCKAMLDAYLGWRSWPIAWAFAGVIALPATTLAIGILLHFLSASRGTTWESLAFLASVPVIVLLGWRLLFTADERARLREFARLRLRYQALTGEG